MAPFFMQLNKICNVLKKKKHMKALKISLLLFVLFFFVCILSAHAQQKQVSTEDSLLHHDMEKALYYLDEIQDCFVENYKELKKSMPDFEDDLRLVKQKARKEATRFKVLFSCYIDDFEDNARRKLYN